MSYWENMGLLRKDNTKCYQIGFLYVRGKHGENRLTFNFRDVATETISNAESIANFTYDKKTKTIFTPNTNLPFVNNARIGFMDGSTMVISSISQVIDENKAQFDKKGIIGLNLYLG